MPPAVDGPVRTEAEPHGPGSHRLALSVAAAAALCLVAAGALLWWREGDAVFASLVTAALAWCF